MAATGELNAGVKRPSAPGNNQQLLYNQLGVEGANSNLTFDYANNSLNVTGNIVATQNLSSGNLGVSQNIANVGNVLVTQNTITGNLTISQNTSAGNIVSANIQGLNANAVVFNPSFYALFSGAQ